MKKYLLIIFLTLILSNLYSDDILPDDTRPLNLRVAIMLAKNQDTDLKKLKLDQKVFDAEHSQAILNFFPTLTSEFTKSNTANILTNPRGTTIISFYNSMSLPIYDRSLIYSEQKAHTQKIFNRLSLQNRLNDMAKEIVTLYYSALNLKYAAEIRQTEHEKAKLEFTISKEKLKYEKALPLDVLMARGYVTETKNLAIDAENEYKRERLKLIHKLNITDDIELYEPEVKMIGDVSFESCLDIARQERVDIKAKLYQMRMKGELAEIEKSVFYPKAELFSDVRHSERSGSGPQLDWSVFVMLSLALTHDVNVSGKSGIRKYSHQTDPVDEQTAKVSLFDRTSNREKKTRAESDYRSIRDEVKDLEHRIKEDLAESYHEYLSAKNNIELADINSDIGDGLVRKARAEVYVGKEAMEKIIEARKKNVQYKIEQVQAKYNYRLAVLKLKWAMGILWKDFVYKD